MYKVFVGNRAKNGVDLRNAFLAEYEISREKRDRALARKPLFSDERAMFSVLDGTSSGVDIFSASNGPARVKLVGHLLHAYRLQRHIDPPLEYLHVTLIDDDWSTSDEKIIIDLPPIITTSTAILDEIAPDWTANIELQVFANRKHRTGGKLLSPHVHAIIRGHHLMLLARSVSERWNRRLTASIQGAAAVQADLIRDTWLDLAHVVRYPYKAPHRCKTVYLNLAKNRVNLHESEKGDRFVRYLRLFQILSLIEQRQLMFAGGAGVALHRWALDRVDRQLARANATFGEVMSLPDVRAFWTNLMPRLGWGRFETPRIITS